MKAMITLVLFTLFFVTCAITVSSLNAVFWVSFALFILVTFYMKRNERELLNQIDDIYGEGDSW